jgi:hypothetical protein
VNCSRKQLCLSYVVFFSLTTLAWGQSPETATASGRVGVATDVASAHTRQDTVAAFLKHMPFIWDHRFAHVMGHESSAGRDPAMLMQQIGHHPRSRQRSPSTPATADVFPDSALTFSPQLSYPIDGLSQNTNSAGNRRIDWSVPLGTGNVAPLQYPAAYVASIDNPDCVNDFVAFALNVAGVNGGQANLVGINELYSSPTGGLCGTQPNVNWAYNGSTAHGKIITSPTINFLDTGVPDGTKIAYVESTPTSSIFHVLTWKAGEGTSATHAANPTAFGSCTSTSSCLVSLTYSTTFSATNASPYVDWQSDKAWVASDDGTIYQLSCAFTCPLNTLPTIEWSFKLPVAGTGGALPMPSTPQYDLNNQLINVTDQLGEIWVINGAGTPSVFAGPMMIGGGGCGIANPPGRTGTGNDCTASGGSYGLPNGTTEDEDYQLIYVFTGNNGTPAPGESAAFVQMNYNLTGIIQAPIGLGSAGNTTTNVGINFPAFDNGWNENQGATAHAIVCGTGTSDTSPYLYSIGFSNWPLMNSTAQQGLQRISVAGIPCSPLTELYNPNLDLGGFPNNPNDHDLLASGLMNATNGYIITDDISSEPAVGLDAVPYTGGVSGIVWDNISTEQQASNLYFSTLGAVTQGTCSNERCAVKLSQLTLQ